MIRRSLQLNTMASPNMRGGTGTGQVQAYFDESAFSTSLAAFNIMSLEPGVTIGLHRHEGSEEIYWIIEGQAQVTDDGERVLLHPGDALLTRNGSTHSLENPGPGVLKFLAVLAKTA
jgi:mannose-6-phosphate isomerase-like protein (cupin superfamily)